MHRITHAGSAELKHFHNNTFLKILSLSYAAIWVYFAISPAWFPEWLLENALVVLFAIGLVLTYKWYPLSDLSYIFIAVFLTFHAYGSHYGYSDAPLGFWIQRVLDSTRPNPYDRIVHFLFGALFGHPVYELLRRYTPLRGALCFVLSASVIISCSALYEIIEALIAWFAPPKVYNPFVGLQGDAWDSVSDIVCACVGTLLALSLTIRLPWHYNSVAQSNLVSERESL